MQIKSLSSSFYKRKEEKKKKTCLFIKSFRPLKTLRDQYTGHNPYHSLRNVILLLYSSFILNYSFPFLMNFLTVTLLFIVLCFIITVYFFILAIKGNWIHIFFKKKKKKANVTLLFYGYISLQLAIDDFCFHTN